MSSNNTIFTFNQDLADTCFDFNPFNVPAVKFESPESYASAASTDLFSIKTPSINSSFTHTVASQHVDSIIKPFDYVTAITENPDIREYMNIGVQNNLKLYCRYPNCEDAEEKFRSYLELAEHMNSHLSTSSFRPEFLCNGVHKFAKSCPFTVLGFKTDVEVKEHKLLRCCDGCNKLFSRADNLATHLRPNAENITPCQKKLSKLMKKQMGLKRSNSFKSRLPRRDSINKSPQKNASSPKKAAMARKTKSFDYSVFQEATASLSNDKKVRLYRTASVSTSSEQKIEKAAVASKENNDDVFTLEYDLYRSPELASTCESLSSLSGFFPPVMESFKISNDHINNDTLNQFADNLFGILSTPNDIASPSLPGSQSEDQLFFQLPAKGTFYQQTVTNKVPKKSIIDDSSQYEYSLVTYDPKNIDWSRI